MPSNRSPSCMSVCPRGNKTQSLGPWSSLARPFYQRMGNWMLTCTRSRHFFLFASISMLPTPIKHLDAAFALKSLSPSFSFSRAVKSIGLRGSHRLLRARDKLPSARLTFKMKQKDRKRWKRQFRKSDRLWNNRAFECSLGTWPVWILIISIFVTSFFSIVVMDNI